MSSFQCASRPRGQKNELVRLHIISTKLFGMNADDIPQRDNFGQIGPLCSRSKKLGGHRVTHMKYIQKFGREPLNREYPEVLLGSEARMTECNGVRNPSLATHLTWPPLIPAAPHPPPADPVSPPRKPFVSPPPLKIPPCWIM